MRRTIVGTTCSRSVEGSADTKSYKTLLLVIAGVLALVISPELYGQATGSFSGNVLDKSGSGVAGATVAATSQGTGLARDVKTDNAGHYLIPLLPVGNYTVHVDASGFQSAESKDLRLQVDEARELDFSLVPAYCGDYGGGFRLRRGSCRDRESISRPSDHIAAGGATTLEWPGLRSTRHAHRRGYGRDESQQLFHLRRQQ